ncbi:MAG TPA: AGE family epimerase/isomerase, partial [Pyrinomonadaceae bacterium]|nr:AGE family epimerase/isomerase [Pyrinomonadaceae bacterium]
MLRRLTVASAVVCLLSAHAAPPRAARPRQSDSYTYAPAGRATYLKFAGEVEAALRRDALGVWFPRSIDREHGGFYANFTRKWEPAPSEGKFSVFQGRMVWVAAQVMLRRPELKEQFAPYVRHGVDYLRDVLWDKQHGGFYWGLDDAGRVTKEFTDGKHLYGISFCLYGLAAAYRATRDPKTLELARTTFRWMDARAHDARAGGYFEWLTRDGRVVRARGNAFKVEEVPRAGFPVGYKSMNTHIHLLEAFTELYGVWKDATLRSRLEELLAIVRDRVCVEPGAMNLYFTNDWRPVPDHDSYGHDVETAYLMLETEEALGRGHSPRTERMARLLVDHALAYGWDDTHGGFYRDGTAAGRAEDLRKEWWAQLEGMNALLMMHEKYGGAGGAYFKAFQRQWRFIKEK